MFSVIFPGQGSQKVGMAKDLYDKYDLVKELFNQADEIFSNLQPKPPTPLAISVAKKGIEAKPNNSTLIISLSLETRASVTLGRVPLLRGIAHKTYVIVG